MEESYNLYPSKPKLKEKEEKKNWSATAFSLVLFIASFETETDVSVFNSLFF